MQDNLCDTGIITKIDNDKLYIQRTDTGGCQNCAIKGLCSQTGGEIVVPISSLPNANTGDPVDIIITPTARTTSVLWIYLLPIILLFIIYPLIDALTALSEPLILLCTLAIVVPAWLSTLKIVNKAFSTKHQIQIRKRTI